MAALRPNQSTSLGFDRHSVCVQGAKLTFWFTGQMACEYSNMTSRSIEVHCFLRGGLVKQIYHPLAYFTCILADSNFAPRVQSTRKHREGTILFPVNSAAFDGSSTAYSNTSILILFEVFWGLLNTQIQSHPLSWTHYYSFTTLTPIVTPDKRAENYCYKCTLF